jgi:hypothetical protein
VAKALSLLESMAADGVIPDAVAYNAAISACDGCFSFFGGISPEFTCSIISAQ